MPTATQLEAQLALACAGLVFVMIAVWVRLFFIRIGEIVARKIATDKLASRSASTKLLKDNRANDHLQNCFEVPVLFFALCAVCISTHVVTTGLVSAAWAYVALRAVQALIHCTYNNVDQRFGVYMLGCLVLFGMWVAVTPNLYALSQQ